ncbi:MAG: RNA methyltransferase [Ignavibacteriales bacterium]|nr:RNA methyltransferase [Ignavibacteriales bacterium]
MRKLTNDDIAKHSLAASHARNNDRAAIAVLLDNIRSLYNVGSIFRTSDGAGIQKLFLTGYTPTPPRREIDKTALGATNSVPWEYARNPLETLATLKRTGVTILALERTDSSRPYTQVARVEFPICLVIGNELTGIAPEVLAACDGALEIPMFGLKHSLNVAVAYGIAVFELVRRWNSDDQPSNPLV